MAHNLEELLVTWEAKDTVCIETGKELITNKLRELVARTAELAREGHLEGEQLGRARWWGWGGWVGGGWVGGQLLARQQQRGWQAGVQGRWDRGVPGGGGEAGRAVVGDSGLPAARWVVVMVGLARHCAQRGGQGRTMRRGKGAAGIDYIELSLSTCAFCSAY